MMLINMALNIVEKCPKKTVYFFAYEQNHSAILSLFLNAWMNIKLSDNNRRSINTFFRDGDLQFVQQEMRSNFLELKKSFFEELINTGRLRIVYNAGPVEDLIEGIKYIKERTDVGIVCIDYMQLLRSKNNYANRQLELKEICLNLNNCAINTGLSIVLNAQFNREVKTEADISLLALREAGDIEHIASLAIGMFNRNFDHFGGTPNKDKKGNLVPKSSSLYIELLKGRSLEVGLSSVIEFDGNRGKIGLKIIPASIDRESHTDSFSHASTKNNQNRYVNAVVEKTKGKR